MSYSFPILMKQGESPLYEEPSKGFPAVYYDADVFKAIEHIVYKQKKEVAWMGLVEQLSDTEYFVYKLYIPEQKVTGTTVDISEHAISKLANRIMDEGHDPNELRYHGHSHVNMSVTPSATDQEHIADYLENIDFFIREIRNKAGEYKVDVFDKRVSKIFQCVNTEIYDLLREQSFYDELDKYMDETIKEELPVRYTPKALAQYYKKRDDFVVDDHAIDSEFLELLADPFYVGK